VYPEQDEQNGTGRRGQAQQYRLKRTGKNDRQNIKSKEDWLNIFLS
jgi:hypothetical protein